MLNNVAPWSEPDYCLSDSWYLANDAWFMIIAFVFVEKYHRSKEIFYTYLTFLTISVLAIQISLIFKHSFSASYLTFNDEYWTVYYKKPFTHIHAFNIGMLLGCLFFDYKQNQLEQDSQVLKLTTAIRESNKNSLLCFFGGIFVQLLVLVLNKSNNSSPAKNELWNMVFLILSRPLFIAGFSLIVMPILLENAQFTSLKEILSHKQWIPYSRLSFGVFLCNSVFMQFRQFNLAHGEWIQTFNLNLLFCAFLTISFIFSGLTYIIFEAPLANLLYAFSVSKHTRIEQQETAKKKKKKRVVKEALI